MMTMTKKNSLRPKRKGTSDILIPVVSCVKRPHFSSCHSSIRSFREWAHRQRESYRKIKAGRNADLDKKRQKQLNDLGFDWMLEAMQVRSRGSGKDEEAYMANIAKLQRIKDVCGDCNELKNIEKVFPGDSKLYNWIKMQRRQYKAWKKGEYSSLSTERRLMLEALDFNFQPRAHYAPFGSRVKEGGIVDRSAGSKVAAEEDSDDE